METSTYQVSVRLKGVILAPSHSTHYPAIPPATNTTPTPEPIIVASTHSKALAEHPTYYAHSPHSTKTAYAKTKQNPFQRQKVFSPPKKDISPHTRPTLLLLQIFHGCPRQYTNDETQ